MAFKLRVGALNMPAGGDTIYVYETGTTVTVSPIFSPDSIGATLSNPFTVPVDGFYGFEPPDNGRVDIWWEEGARFIMEDVNVRDIYLDSGNPLPQYILNGEDVDYYDFNTSLAEEPTAKDGRLFWNDADKTINMMSNSCVLQIGQEMWVRARNTTSSTILNGTPVSIIGSTGNQVLIGPTNAADTTSAKRYIGLVTEDIVHNDVGFVTIAGSVRGLNTSSYSTEGVKLWVDPTVIGGITETEPIGVDGYKIRIGYVKYKHNTQGEIIVDNYLVLKLKDLSEAIEGDDLVIESDDDLQLRALGNRILLDPQGTNGYVESLAPIMFPSFTNSNLPSATLFQGGCVIWNSEEKQLYINDNSIEWIPSVETRILRDEFVAEVGGQYTFSTSETYSPNTNSILVFIDGILQDKDNYTEIDNRNIYINDGVEGGSSVFILYLADLIIPEQSTDSINYTATGIGGTEQTVTEYLDRIGFITSYGADPTGVNDSVIAIQAAESNHSHIFVPEGTFLVGTNLTISSDVTILGGGVIEVASGVTLTINGNFDSYLGQMFTGDGNIIINGPTRIYSLKTLSDLRNYIGFDGIKVETVGKIRFWETINAPYIDNEDTIIVPTLGDGSGAWVY